MNPNGASKPVSPNKMMIAFAMLVLGLGVPFTFFFLKKMLDTSVKNKMDLGRISIPFLAEVPLHVTKNKNVDEDIIVVEAGKRDMMNEAFRVLRTNVDLILGRKSGSKVIMFTSFNPASGKTFNVANLAASMALKGAKTVLIDLDLRKASLSKRLDLIHSGVASYLNGKTNDYRDNFYILPVGTLPPNPTELLLTDRFKEMIDSMKQEFDYIFLDCPPIDIVADSNIVTEYADLTVMVLRANLIKKDVLPFIEDLYRDDKLKHLALILNGVELQYKKYGYGKSGYGYGYGYSSADE